MMIKKLIRMAKQVLRWIRRMYNKSGKKHLCYICGQSFRQFLPYRSGEKGVCPFALEMQMIGSDDKNFACPCCGCHDRERHLVMYFDRLDLWAKIRDGDVLHFAPECHLPTRITQHHPASYVKADLTPSSPEVQPIDITQIPFDDNSFDLIICNHVLEHVPDDRRALSELFRVLRPGGWEILQTPYSDLLQNSFCDTALNTDELRRRFYGQEDHVRVYGRDLFQRIEEAGFEVHIKTHVHILTDIDASFWGVNPKENLILVTKPPAA